MSSKTRKTFFAVYFFIGQFRILLLKRYLVCIGTSKKRLETPLLRTKQLNFLLPASRQVFTYKQSTITHQKVTAMQPADEEGVDDMATLTELHGGAIMHNLHQRYRRDQIYVSAASGCRGDRPQRAFPASREPRVNLSKRRFQCFAELVTRLNKSCSSCLLPWFY